MSLTRHPNHLLYASGFRKHALSIPLALAMGSASTITLAALPTNAVLNFTDGIKTCVIGGTFPNCTHGVSNIASGSFFSMDQNGDGTIAGSEKTAIANNDGLIIGVTQPATGSHGGAPDGSETPGIDAPWLFFSNTGMHFTSTPVTVTVDNGTSQDLDFSGWSVTWNGIPTISMGGGAQDCGTSADGICVDNSSNDIAGVFDNGTGIATLTCGTDCSNGDTFTLEYNAIVPQADPSNFGGVNYALHLEGTISLPGAAPSLNDDSGHRTIIGNPLVIDVLDNDTSADGFDLASVAVSTPPSNGTADDTNPDGTIEYTPNPAFSGPDSFEYTVDSTTGTPASSPALVSIDVQTNVAPVANDDTLNISTATLSNQPQTVTVLANDTDANNGAGLPGGIDASSIIITSNATVGTCVANGDGTITYSQTPPAQPVSESCTYSISDIDTSGTAPLTATATLNIVVTALQSDWPTTIGANIIPVLAFDPGVAGNPSDSSVAAQSGSYFTMQVTQQTLIYTVIEPGPDGGLIIGYDQPATGSHTGAPNGTEQPGFTAPWLFFSNTGFDLTQNGGITGNPDGTLNFSGRYAVTWNGIPTINLGGSSDSRFSDLGFATIRCTPAPCENQSSFTLDYAAHVEDLPGQSASGFNGVPYTLHLEGSVQFLDATPVVSNGTIATLDRLTDSDVDDDADVRLQCIGGCFEYTITGVTDSRVSLVLPLAGGVRDNPVWRIFDGNAWRTFDTSAGDSVKSAPYVVGASGMECPAPNDAAYRDITTGDQCIQLSIADNGLNDLDLTVGIISDPSGLGAGGTAGGGTVFEDTRTSSTSGCTIATSSASGVSGDWLLIGGLLACLGLYRRRLMLS